MLRFLHGSHRECGSRDINDDDRLFGWDGGARVGDRQPGLAEQPHMASFVEPDLVECHTPGTDEATVHTGDA